LLILIGEKERKNWKKLEKIGKKKEKKEKNCREEEFILFIFCFIFENVFFFSFLIW